VNIILHNVEEGVDGEMLAACTERISRHIGNDEDIYSYPDALIFVNRRDTRGWLEYGIKINYRSGNFIYIGAIQREIGAQIEFHS
jgi:hypothetical protein